MKINKPGFILLPPALKCLLCFSLFSRPTGALPVVGVDPGQHFRLDTLKHQHTLRCLIPSSPRGHLSREWDKCVSRLDLLLPVSVGFSSGPVRKRGCGSDCTPFCSVSLQFSVWSPSVVSVCWWGETRVKSVVQASVNAWTKGPGR